MIKVLRFSLLGMLAVLGGTASADVRWVKTAPANLQTGDVLAIVDETSARAMSNNNSTSKAPDATEITLSDDLTEITGDVDATLQWVLTVNEGMYQFKVADTENYLYGTDSNNGLRVGTNSNNVFTLSDGDKFYLVNSATNRYVGVYNSQDWRCYTSINSNIQNTVTSFYKKTTAEEPVFEPTDCTAQVNVNGWKSDMGNVGDYTKDVAQKEQYLTNTTTNGQVLYQTVEGLANGTYTVELYANASYTEGRGFASAALNGDLGRVIVYASDVEKTIPVIYQTGVGTNNIVELANVVVTDGTLKMGMRKDIAGSNWHTIQIKSLVQTSNKANADDAAQVAYWKGVATSVIEANANVGGVEKAALTDAETRAAVQEALVTFYAARPAYNALADAIAAAETAGVDVADAKTVLASAETTAEGASAALHIVKLAVNTKSVEGASAENGVTTNFVINGTFDTAKVANPWKTTTGAQNQTTANNQQGAFGVTNSYFFENWNPSAFTGKIYQEIEDIPNGNYTLKIAAFVNTLNSDVQHVYANADQTPITSTDPTAYEVKTLVTNNKIEIGFEQTQAEGSANWVGIDNVSLVYYGEADLTEFVNAYNTALADAQAIEGVMNRDVAAALAAAIAAEVDQTDANSLGAATAALTEAAAAAKASVAAYAAAETKLAAMKELVDATNVYTAEALATYYTQWVDKFATRTLTTEEANALQDPSVVTKWHADITVDNFLLSAWDTNPDFVNAPYYINSWSTEGNNDGSEFKVPFFEYWTDNGNSLGEKTMTATMNVAPGNYAISAWVRVRIKDGAEAPAAGITLQGNDGEAVNVADGAQVGTSQFYLKNVEATATVGEDGVLAIKFIVAADNNISWLSFKYVKFEVTIDKTALETAIADAKTAAEALTNENAKTYLNAAITAAETAATEAKTQEEVDAAVTALNEKVAIAKEAEAYQFGQYAQYSWESPKGIICEKGGTIACVNGVDNRLNYPQAGYNTICLSGKKNNLNDETSSKDAVHMELTLAEPVQEGDVIRMSAFINKNASKTASAWFVFENDATLAGEVYGDEANIYSGEDVTFNGVVTTKDVVVPAEAAGSKTIKITRNTAGTNLFITKLEILRMPVDITLNVESGKDIAAELAAAVEGKDVASITINLAEGGTYALDTTITTGVDFALVGNGSTITMAESRTDNFLTLDGTTEFALKADGTESDHKLIKTVSVSGVKVLGLKAALVRDNQKTLVETLTVENSVVEMPAAGKNVFDFNGKGYAGKLVVNNSTIYAAAANSGFFAQYGSRPKNIDGSWLQVFDIQNSTIVNIANGKNMCDLKQNGTAQNVYVVKNNIFVDCGKQNQVIVGLNKGQANGTPSWDVDGNIFNWGGADVSAAEFEKAGKAKIYTSETEYYEEDIVKNSIAAVVTFADAAAGNFNATLALAEGAVAPESVGDPRWTVTVGGGEEIADGIYDLTQEMFKTWASHEATEGTTIGCAFAVETATQMVYGDSNVGWLNYADLSGYDKLVVIATSGAPRFCFNRTVDNAQDNDDPATSQFIDIPGHSWGTEAYETVDENNQRFIIDLKKMTQERGFAHLHAIKGANWADVVVVAMKLVKGDVELPSGIENIAAVAAQKDGKFFVNGKLVIVRNGQQFNAKGQLVK